MPSVLAGRIQACRQPSSRTERSFAPLRLASQPGLKLSLTTRYDSFSACTWTERASGFQRMTCIGSTVAFGAGAAPAGRITAPAIRYGSAEFTRIRRLPGGITTLAPWTFPAGLPLAAAADAWGSHETNGTGL